MSDIELERMLAEEINKEQERRVKIYNQYFGEPKDQNIYVDEVIESLFNPLNLGGH